MIFRGHSGKQFNLTITGLIALNFDDFFFKFSPNSALRGHPFKLTVPISKCNRSKYFFSSRIVPSLELLASRGGDGKIY